MSEKVLILEGRSVEIYTDGSCAGNNRPGGWAYVVSSNDQAVFACSGGRNSTQGHTMEFEAIKQALSFIPKGGRTRFTIISDSLSIVETINKHLKGLQVEVNKRDFQSFGEIKNLIEGRNVQFVWKRRESTKLNRLADFIARNETERRKVSAVLGLKISNSVVNTLKLEKTSDFFKDQEIKTKKVSKNATKQRRTGPVARAKQ